MRRRSPPAERLAVETEALDELGAVLEQVSEETRGMAKARLLLHLGKLRDEKLDDADGAEAAYRRALEADPASPEALEALTLPLQAPRPRPRPRHHARAEARGGGRARREEGDAPRGREALRRRDEGRGGGHHRAPPHPRARRLGRGPRSRSSPRCTGASSAGRTSRRSCPAPATSPRPTRTRIAFQLQIAALDENEIGDDEAAVEAYRTVLGLDDRSREALGRARAALHEARPLRRAEPGLRAADRPRRGRPAGAGRGSSRRARASTTRSSTIRAAPSQKNEAILAIDGGNLPAVKALERLYRDASAWDKLIPVMQHHLTLVQDRREQVALEVAIGEVWWKELSRVDRAEAIFNHALQLDPESREAVSALGRLYERSGNWNLALDMLRREARSAAAARMRVDVHVRIGAIFEDMLLDPASAKDAYGRALQLDPGCLPAIRALKGIAERERDRDRYLEMLIEEARYVPEVEEKTRLYTEVGRVYQEERDDRDQAARYYEEALKRTAGHPEAARPLSDIYVAQTRWADAERVLEAMVDLLGQDGRRRRSCAARATGSATWRRSSRTATRRSRATGARTSSTPPTSPRWRGSGTCSCSSSSGRRRSGSSRP